MRDQPRRMADVAFRVGAKTYTLPADRVTHVDRMPALVRSPGLPPVVVGVTNIGGQVVPVIDLRLAFGEFPAEPASAGEVLVVTHGPNAFALKVDQVLRVSAEQGGDERGPDRIEIDDLLSGLMSELLATVPPTHPGPDAPPQAGSAFRATVTPVETFGSKSVASARRLEATALAVDTDLGVHHLSIEQIETLSDTLAIAAVPDPNPAFLGVTIHRSRAIPVLRLDLLRGEPPSPSAPGAFVIASIEHRSFAIAVKRIRGLTFDPAQRLSLPDMLAPFLVPGPDDVEAETSSDEREAQPHTRYLLVDIAGQPCAFRLGDVDRVQSECRIVSVPTDRMRVSGLTTVGGLVLPLLDAAAVLGLDHKTETPSGETPSDVTWGGYVVAADPDVGSFVVPVSRLLRMVTIADAAVLHMGEDTALAAVTRYDGRAVWVLSTARLAEHAGWRRHAA